MQLHTSIAPAVRLRPVLIACLLVLQSCTTLDHRTGPEYTAHGIPRFLTVSQGIYRGGQPDAEGWAYLKSIGVKTVIKLNYEHEGSDREALDLGMTVIDASMPPSDYTDFYQTPPAEKIRIAIQVLQDENRHPVYVHCLHGQDRTGLVVGMYRVLHNHYTKEQAYREMLDNNFHPWFLGLSDMWDQFDGKSLPE